MITNYTTGAIHVSCHILPFIAKTKFFMLYALTCNSCNVGELAKGLLFGLLASKWLLFLVYPISDCGNTGVAWSVAVGPCLRRLDSRDDSGFFAGFGLVSVSGYRLLRYFS